LEFLRQDIPICFELPFLYVLKHLSFFGKNETVVFFKQQQYELNRLTPICATRS